MDTLSYDAQIKEGQAKIDELFGKLEGIRQGFVKATGSFIGKWFTETVERNVKWKAEQTKQMAPARLKQLKADLNALVAKTDQIATEGLKSKDLWPLQQEWPENAKNDSSAYFELKKRAGELIEPAVKGLIGPLGRLLIDAGFVKEKDQEWKNQGAPVPRYAENYRFEWSKDMQAKWKQYEDTSYEISRAYDALKNVEKTKAEAQAKDLWDNA
jgi:hypothetical protein